MTGRQPRSTLFPYTTLFRSLGQFPQIGHTAQLTIGYELRFNFSLPFILLRKLEQHGLLSLDRWLELRSEEHTSELQSRRDLVCRLLLEKKIKADFIDADLDP